MLLTGQAQKSNDTSHCLRWEIDKIRFSPEEMAPNSKKKKCHSSKFPNSASFLLSSQSAHRIYIIRYSKLVDMSLQFFRSIDQLVDKKTPNVHPIERSIQKSCHKQ